MTMERSAASTAEGVAATGLAARLAEAIELHHADPRFDVNALARLLHVSRRQLYRHASGGGVASMLDERRVVAACALLVSRPDLTIAEIAERSGFGMRSRMRAQFALRVGRSPAQYRKNPHPVAGAAASFSGQS